MTSRAGLRCLHARSDVRASPPLIGQVNSKRNRCHTIKSPSSTRSVSVTYSKADTRSSANWGLAQIRPCGFAATSGELDFISIEHANNAKGNTAMYH